MITRRRYRHWLPYRHRRGHILTVPYFAQGTNKTLLNIVNTDTVNGKAVKLRYRAPPTPDTTCSTSPSTCRPATCGRPKWLPMPTASRAW
ncbi:MAG: hypothetical protein U1E74_05750 [Paenacidovorax caeni]